MISCFCIEIVMECHVVNNIKTVTHIAIFCRLISDAFYLRHNCQSLIFQKLGNFTKNSIKIFIFVPAFTRNVFKRKLIFSLLSYECSACFSMELSARSVKEPCNFHFCTKKTLTVQKTMKKYTHLYLTNIGFLFSTQKKQFGIN